VPRSPVFLVLSCMTSHPGSAAYYKNGRKGNSLRGCMKPIFFSQDRSVSGLVQQSVVRGGVGQAACVVRAVRTSSGGQMRRHVGFSDLYRNIFSVFYSTLLHLPPLRFHCVGSNPGQLRLRHWLSNHSAGYHPSFGQISSVTRLDIIHCSARSHPSLGEISSALG
jgi:hypothetical protein